MKIGVIIYTRVGTNTSILMDEFRFFNNFKRANPNVDFVFIAISDFTKKSVLQNRDQLEFPVSVITIKNREDLKKLKGLSGVFSYMTRNTFFGGAIDKSCALNYAISAYATNQLGIPLFVRTPDSEYPYMDYKKMVDNRINGTTASAEKFRLSNLDEIALMPDYIDYDKIYFIANGSRVICQWVVDIAHNDIPESMRMLTPEKIEERTLFVSDADLFNVWTHYQNYAYLPKEAKENKLVFIGYLQGSVSKNRLKALPKIFSENKHEIPTDIIGPGASELKISREDVTLHDMGVYGKSFFETMNGYLAYIFVGKGNAINKYINKTVYDCISARCPVIVYTECDKTGVIFNNRDFYFSNEDELKAIYEKLKNPEIRRSWIDAQFTEIHNKLNTIMDPMINFSDYCEEIDHQPKAEITIKPLF